MFRLTIADLIATVSSYITVCSCTAMLVSRVVVVSLLIFINDINVTGIVRRNPVGDNEDNTGISSGSDQDTLKNNDSNSYCDDAYANYSECSFNRKLITLTSNGQVIITTDVMLLSIISLEDLDNITIIGHDSPTVNCDNSGGLHFDNCHNCIIIGIMWEKCGNINDSKPAIQLYNSSNIIIESCSFKHSATQAIVLSQMSGNVTISGCNFAFNNHYKDHGVAIHYLSRIKHHLRFQFTISKCNFTHNGMTTAQSVVYIGPSSSKYMEQISLMDLIFLNNRGTPIYISNQNFILSGDILFKENVADRGGGIFINNYTESIFHKLDIKFIHNNASYGGAIYIHANAYATFEGNCTVTINNNQAERDGGALFISDNSNVTFEGSSTVTINNNQADHGGALFISDNSNVTFEGSSTVAINNNQAEHDGGALYIDNNSDVTFEGNSTVTIYNNQADYGGALLIYDNSDVTFEGSSTVTINNNQANDYAGALYIGFYSNVTFEGNSTVTINNNQADYCGALCIGFKSNVTFEGNSTVTINNNQAEHDGGALCNYYSSDVTFEGNSTVTINNNQANYDGGALYIYFNRDVTFEGNSTVTINNNQAEHDGGALYIRGNSDVTFEGNSTVTINNNQAEHDGGALYITGNSDVTFEGNFMVTINNNQAEHDGGAIYILDNSNVIFEGNSTVIFNNNQATYRGGALFIARNSNVTFGENSTVTINNNQANANGGALFVVDNSDIVFERMSVVKFCNNTSKVDGGALYIMDNCKVAIKGSSIVTFNNNVALGDGGALYSIINSDFTLKENSVVKFNGNRASSFGGGLFSNLNSNIMFDNKCIISFNHNEASQGGAIFTLSNTAFKENPTVNNKTMLAEALLIPDLTFKDNAVVTFNSNRAVMNGGALYCDHCSITMNEHSTVIFIHNIAENGGAVSISVTFLLISEHSNVTFDQNIAKQDGGAIYFNGEDNNIIFENSSTVTLISNIADRGGAIYSKITQNPKYFNIIEINFSDNTARVAGNLLYIDVSQSCNNSCLTDRTAGISAEILQHGPAKNLIATSPNILKLHYPAKCISNNSARCDKYYIDNIMLGQELAIHACLLDHYNKPAEVTQFRIVGENNRNYDIHGSEYTSISCNHSIGGISIIGNDIITSSAINYSILFTSSLVFNIARRNISVDLTVELSPCHSGFQYHGKSQRCECYNNSEIVQCSGSISSIKRGYWFGHVTGVPTITYCPINYCNFTCCKATNGYYDLSPVRVNQCRSRRSGIACGNCEDGHTLSFDSPECISNNKCSTGQSILVVTLTVLYWFIAVIAVFIVMYYQIGIGYFYAVTYYYSVVDILLSPLTDLSNELYTAVTIMSSIAKVTPQFLGQLCLLKNMSGIDQQLIHYVHPLAVSLILIIISWLAKHLKRFSAFVSRVIIHAICFLLLLSYTLVATTSLLLMRSLTFADVNNVYTYLSPDTQYFHDRHLVYGIIAIILALLIVIGLPLLLLLEPFLNSKINFIRIKPLLDQFQGCYKDKYRCFAAYYMICRLIIITIIIANIPEEFISRYLLITATTITALIHLVVRPYSDNILNISDGAILQLMVLVSALPLFEYFDTLDSSFAVGIAFVLVILPLVQFVVLMIFVSKQKIIETIKNTINHFTFQFKSHTSEPDNINNNTVSNDFDLVIDDSMRRNATICEM